MSQHDLLIVTAPFCQPNTPYPASAFLKGYLIEKGIATEQLDLSIEVLDAILTPDFIQTIVNKVSSEDFELYLIKNQYVEFVSPVKHFLQGSNEGFAYQINQGILPTGHRNGQLEENIQIYTEDTIIDQARYRATVFIEEIIDIIAKYEDPNFGFSRYAERISSFSAPFRQIEEALDENTLITDLFKKILDRKIAHLNPKFVAFSIPFPGNLLSTLHCCKYIKTHYPNITITIGGGFVNTELRGLKEARLFQYVDFVTLDDGEKPLEHLIQNKIYNKQIPFVRTFYINDGNVTYVDNSKEFPLSHEEIGTPDYTGLPWDRYMCMVEMTNPMHRLWTEGKWVKMMVAHGCYWHKCSFCDTSLDYIKRYSQASANTICDRIECIIDQTNISSFHFIDEAAPPKVLMELSFEIIRRKLKITWWTNLRFEKTFTPSLARLMAKAGCIGVSGGLEVASDRLLEKMNKGVSISQVARVTKGMNNAGILVHAYLMYGFPTQTAQETIDSLEVVRQLFEQGCISSGFWHRFAMTVHSPVGIAPEDFDVERVDISDKQFAENDCEHIDHKGADNTLFGEGLRKSLYNYMHMVGFDFNLQEWFDHKVPTTLIPVDHIEKAISYSPIYENNPRARLWINPDFDIVIISQKKKKLKVAINTDNGVQQIGIDQNAYHTIQNLLSTPYIREKGVFIKDIEKTIDQSLETLFIHKIWPILRSSGWEIL
ncbi:radical SAM protein [Halosquirtibacter xylanolyticus]|uniref:B12-binding domain-containing radical SAM protein n=1 Tax=Halosquirtibacter xylanolyticus TaxID=3374599 RepID=UPI00374793E7|nr:radical SAM protein [Prolixibacteraceae bacterium]